MVATGDQVNQFNVGDKVCALLESGGYADYAIVKATQTLPIPDNLSMKQAAALPEALFTVWHHLFMQTSIKAGQLLLIHGGTSGIGTTAILLAKAFGITTYATARTDEKCQAIKQLGASEVINYQHEDFEQRILELTHNKGVDVIFDMVGGNYTPKHINVLSHGGILMIIGLIGGVKTDFNLATLLSKNITIMGCTLRDKPSNMKRIIAQQIYKNIWPLIQNNTFLPVIDSVFDFSEVGKAHSRMESSAHIGKIILQNSL